MIEISLTSRSNIFRISKKKVSCTRNMIKLFISGFPLKTTELELVQLIGPYATVHTIKIVRDKASGKPKGYAFLEIDSETEAARAAVALDGTMMGDRALTVNIATEKSTPDFPPTRSSTPQRNKRPRTK
jgi:RNA recognition motif-containing protein